MRALNSYILVEPLDRDDELREFSVLSVPKSEFAGLPTRGIVKFVAKGIDIRPGQVVVFDEYNPSGFKWGGEKFLHIHEDKIRGVLV